MWTARVLLAAVLVVCVTSSADAWRRHHGYYGDGERGSARTLDEWRARQAQGQNNEQPQNRDQARGDDRGQDGAQSRAENPDRWQDRYRDRYDRRRARYDEWRRAREDRRRDRDEELNRSRAADRGDVPRGRSGPFGATIEKLVRGCAVQGAEFENWPLDAISRTVGADETQRKALDGLRDAAKQVAQRLSTDCPQDVPAAPAARLEAAEQGIAATLAAFDTVEPKLQAFYAALNTPVGRMETMRKRLTAVRAATAAIRPALARFYEALDQGQKVRFAGMS
jgi:hypothetical protein